MSLKKNVLANYLGQGWTALMGIAFVPLYIKYLGMESYGLIGVFAMLQAWLTLLDMGMTPTLNREMARFTAGAHTAQSIRDLLRSLEVLGFLAAFIIAVLVWSASGWLGNNWLHAEKLPVEEVVRAIAIMGLLMALRFVESIYRGAILGLQKQVWINVTNASLATIRGIGAVAVLAWVSPSIQAFFLWQIVVSITTVAIVAMAVHRFLPRAEQPSSFSWPAIRGVWKFAGGMLATTLLVLLLTQVDKVLLSRLLSLESFGYYMLAATVAGVLYQLIAPVTQAFYPRFTELVTKEDTAALIASYHRSAQIISVVVIPAALMLVFFGEDILRLWTGNETLANQAAPLLALLALGTMINALMNIPYFLTLAYNWPSFAVRVNIVVVLVLVPAILWATPRYGAVGAAGVWVVLNASYLIFAVHFIHRRLLPKEKWRWYTGSVIFPMLGALGAGMMFRYILHVGASGSAILIWLIGSGVAMVLATGLTIPYFRGLLIEKSKCFCRVA